MSLPLYRRPALRPLGRRAARKAPVRRVEYAAVALRAAGKCELCGRPQDPLDDHHAFGRGHLPGIPARWCETRELLLGICRRCHDQIHAGDQVAGDYARCQAVMRFAARHELTSLPLGVIRDPLEVMRQLVRELEARNG